MSKNNLEIEQKYLVESLDKVTEYVDLDNCNVENIEQGYLSSNPTIRVRKYNDDYCITYKSRVAKNETIDDIIVNHEVELPLTKESYEHMLSKIDYNLVEKIRYKVPLDNGLIAELDIFKGKLEGLIMVEVEFKSEEEAKKFRKPKWFGENVSGDKKYKNLFLAQVESVDAI